MALVFAAITPHPPILIPEVGKGEEKKLEKTTTAMEKLARELNQAEPDAIIFITPHTLLYPDSFNICAVDKLYGDFSDFGAPSYHWQGKNDLELAYELEQAGDANDVSTILFDNGEDKYKLDHGVMVPLYFLSQKLESACKILPIGYSYASRAEHFEFGQIIAEVAAKSDKRIALIASGDLSHRLAYSAPEGATYIGEEFDQKIIELIKKGDDRAIINLEKDFVSDAGECAYHSILVLLGALSEKKHASEVYSYEGPFGVGYMVANFKLKGKETKMTLPKLAHEAIRKYLESGERIKAPKDMGDEWKGRAGVFVSIHSKLGELRGCIGTIFPVRANIAEEVIDNAISAATSDLRFEPIQTDEIDDLDLSVDVLTKPQICKISELDPRKYGAIVTSDDGRKGLLLPDLEGVDSVSDQISICRRKAGIRPEEKIKIERFEVKRFH